MSGYVLWKTMKNPYKNLRITGAYSEVINSVYVSVLHIPSWYPQFSTTYKKLLPLVVFILKGGTELSRYQQP